MNAKMPELKKALESAGFTDVKTVLSSGNVVFTAPKTAEASLQQKVEAAFEKGAAFMVLIEKTLGRDVTTRTWDTVAKVAR